MDETELFAKYDFLWNKFNSDYRLPSGKKWKQFWKEYCEFLNTLNQEQIALCIRHRND